MAAAVAGCGCRPCGGSDARPLEGALAHEAAFNPGRATLPLARVPSARRQQDAQHGKQCRKQDTAPHVFSWHGIDTRLAHLACACVTGHKGCNDIANSAHKQSRRGQGWQSIHENQRLGGPILIF